MSQHLLVGGIAALHTDPVSCLCDTLLKIEAHSPTHLSEVLLMEWARSRIQSFVLLPLDWEFEYVADIKTVEMVYIHSMHKTQLSMRISQF